MPKMSTGISDSIWHLLVFYLNWTIKKYMEGIISTFAVLRKFFICIIHVSKESSHNGLALQELLVALLVLIQFCQRQSSLQPHGVIKVSGLTTSWHDCCQHKHLALNVDMAESTTSLHVWNKALEHWFTSNVLFSTSVCCSICDSGIPSSCVCIKFCFKLRKNATENSKMLKLFYGEQIMGRT